jgi:hypothetical protein
MVAVDEGATVRILAVSCGVSLLRREERSIVRLRRSFLFAQKSSGRAENKPGIKTVALESYQ